MRTVAAGLCHSDLHFMEAKYPCPVPAVLGHESAGVVEAVGSDVSYVQPGDHVISCVSGFCGTCGYCLSGRPHLCDKVGLDRGAPAAAAARQRARVPVLRPLELRRATARAREHAREDPTRYAARQGCAHRLRRHDRRRRGAEHRDVYVRAKLSRSSVVVASGSTRSRPRRSSARAASSRSTASKRSGTSRSTFGATDVVDAHPRRGRRSARAHRRWRRLRVRSDRARGDGATGVQHVAQGRHRDRDRHDPPRRTSRDRRIPTAAREEAAGSNMGSNRFRIDMPQYVDWYLAGKLKLDELVSATMPLEKINDGFEALRAARSPASSSCSTEPGGACRATTTGWNSVVRERRYHVPRSLHHPGRSMRFVLREADREQVRGIAVTAAGCGGKPGRVRGRPSVDEAGMKIERPLRLEAPPRGFAHLRVARDVRSVGEHREDRRAIRVAIDVADRGGVDRGEVCTCCGQPARPREAVGVPRVRWLVRSTASASRSVRALGRWLARQGDRKRRACPSPSARPRPDRTAPRRQPRNGVRVHPGSRPIAGNAGAKNTRVRRVRATPPRSPEQDAA